MASIVVIGLVLLLNILAFVLAIGAERRRSTVSFDPVLRDLVYARKRQAF